MCNAFFVPAITARYPKCGKNVAILPKNGETSAIKQRSIIKLLETLESFLYLRADYIVSVTCSFKLHILKKGVIPERISVVTNGADFDRFNPLPKQNPTAKTHHLEDKFVVSFIGTHGMAHSLQTVLKAANLLKTEKQIIFLLVSDGAERDNLVKEKEVLGLGNVLMLPQQPKEKIPEFLAASDACMVFLKKSDLFKTVIPSKIFEAMAMERPIILGVEGESKEIIDEANCGLCIEPENHHQLAEAVLRLYNDPKLSESLGRNGRRFVKKNFDRDKLAKNYLGILQKVLRG